MAIIIHLSMAYGGQRRNMMQLMSILFGLILSFLSLDQQIITITRASLTMFVLSWRSK